MIPQTQRWWRGPVLDQDGKQTDEGGDCFSACLASILELPIDGFPNFLAEPWWERWQQWAYDEHRMELLYWEDRATWPDPAGLAWWIGEVIVGKTPHSTVFYRDEFKWDPAPEALKREWSLSDIKSIVAPFCVASIFDREPGIANYDALAHAPP